MKKLILPEGKLTAKTAIVGEAPGKTEILYGKSFIGRSGTLLTQLMNNAGLLRYECYITNVIKEYPENNDIGKFISFERGVSSSKTYDEYEKQLYEELSHFSGNLIIACGNVALYALTRETGITKWRGSVLKTHPSTGLDKKVIPILHPASCLRMYIWTYFILIDLIKAVKEQEYQELIVPERNYITAPSYERVISFLEKLIDEKRLVSYDIEVINEQVSCMAFCNNINEGICIPFSFNGGNFYTAEQELEIWKKSAEILESPKIRKIGQNFIFDTTFVFRRYGIVTKNYDDTMVAQAIISPDFPKSLAMIASVYTTMPYYKEENKMWKGTGGSFQQFWNYNIKDVFSVLEAWPKMQEDLQNLGNMETYKRQVGIIPSLMFMAERGVRINMEAVKKSYRRNERNIERYQRILNKIAGEALNPNSPKQLKDYFYIKKGFPAYTYQGKISTDENAMKRLIRKGAKEAHIIMEMRKLRKMNGTYLEESKFDSDGRLRCSYNPVGTPNGRVSSGATIFATGNNMQNQPPFMKKLMLFDNGYVGFNVDLSQAENRIVAFVSGESAMMQAFENNIDIHSQTGALISGKTIEQVKEENRLKITAPLGDGSKTWRFWGKKTNHGLNYGEGYKKFSLINEIPEREGKKLVDAYHNIYPGIHNWHDKIIEQLRINRTLTNCFGRKRRFLDRWGETLFNQGYNFNPQSTVADKINLHGLIYVFEDSFLNQTVEMLAQIHDSLHFQIKINLGWEVILKAVKLICESLEKPLKWHNRTFIIPAEAEIGTSFGSSKGFDWKTVSPETLKSLYEEMTK